MKRLVSILLACVLLACLLAGCGGSAGYDNSYAAAEETAEEAYDSGFSDGGCADLPRRGREAASHHSRPAGRRR